jgi:hypothetical protein
MVIKTPVITAADAEMRGIAPLWPSADVRHHVSIEQLQSVNA